MLAAAGLGAVFSSTSPDFGTTGVLDRFSQISPTVLFACADYPYGGRRHDCTERLRNRAGLPSLRRTVVWSRAGSTATAPASGPDRLRRCSGAALRPSLVRAVLVGHDRSAQVHRAPGRRAAGQAPGRAPAALRRAARRPGVLLHDHGLDDVELARLDPGVRRDGGAL